MKSQALSNLSIFLLLIFMTQVMMLWAQETPKFYTCCCSECGPKTGGSRLPRCYTCRNTVHYCNCDNCSCFPPEPKIEVNDDTGMFRNFCCASSLNQGMHSLLKGTRHRFFFSCGGGGVGCSWPT